MKHSHAISEPFTNCNAKCLPVMATIHPSRMALVPQEPNAVVSRQYRGRSPSLRPREAHVRSTRDSPTYDRDYKRSRFEDENESRGNRDGERDRGRDRSRGDDRRDRSRDIDRRHRNEDRDRGGDKERRRASPEYTDYRRPSPPLKNIQSQTQAPWRQQENMYPNRRQERDRPVHAGGSYGGGGGGGADFMERCVCSFLGSTG